jgi:hypothetical protein
LNEETTGDLEIRNGSSAIDASQNKERSDPLEPSTQKTFLESQQVKSRYKPQSLESQEVYFLSVQGLFLSFITIIQKQRLDQSLSLCGVSNEPFFGRPFCIFAFCVDAEWRLRKGAVLIDCPFKEGCCYTNLGPS